jgi:hypothetical protein
MTAWKHHVNKQGPEKAAQSERGSGHGTSVAPSPSLAASSIESGWLNWFWHKELKNSTVAL